MPWSEKLFSGFCCDVHENVVRLSSFRSVIGNWKSSTYVQCVSQSYPIMVHGNSLNNKSPRISYS
ncbi:hypothetical protein M5D96_013680, partial [Drosophila gunungcola]